jgi:hypothetical protein
MKLGNREFELIHNQNKPEVLKALPEKGYGFKYFEFLVDRNYDIPEEFLDIVLKHYSNNNTVKAEFMDVAAKLKIRKGDIPEKLTEYMIKYLSPATLVEYVISVLGSDYETEIEKPIMDKILKDNVATVRYVSMVMTTDVSIPIPSEMFETIKNNPSLCMKVALSYLKYGMKKYEKLDKNLIEGIAKDSNVAERFAHLVQPYVDETPAEILAAVKDESKIKPKWHKGMSESFSTHFSKISLN